MARIAVMAAGFLVAASLPAAAATSLVDSDGTLHTVWVVRTRYLLDSENPGPWQLAYSVTYASGETRTGVISPTEDAARDSSPRLALDPSSRKPILVWARDDGTSMQIAYARFEATGWTDFHYLTFARSDDTLPRIGISLYGSFLFFVEDNLRYVYAPIDLARGRLYAAPKAVPYGTLQKNRDALYSEPGATGATRYESSSIILDPGDGTTQGNQDVPININCDKNGGCKSSSTWDVGSRQDCRPQVLVIPERDLSVAYVVRFDNGAAAVLKTLAIPYPIPEDFAITTAAAALEPLCSSLLY
jgi:hypothetical protein